ncbi:hypothetical protein JCM6882_008354 [Rhodosporidiobolus microsporus]
MARPKHKRTRSSSSPSSPSSNKRANKLTPPSNKLTIADLPPEIVLQIVEHVEHLTAHERQRLAGLAGAGADDDGLGLGGHGGAAAGGGAGAVGADLLNAMMGGLFGLGAGGGAGAGAGGGGFGGGNAAGGFGGGGAGAAGGAGGAGGGGGLFGGLFGVGGGGGAGGAAGAAAGAGGANRPGQFLFGGGAGQGMPGGLNGGANQTADSDTDDEMPALEAIDSTAAPSASQPAASASTTAAASSTTPAATPPPASASRNPFSLFGFGSSSRSAAPATPTTAATPAASTSNIAAEAREADSDVDMPPSSSNNHATTSEDSDDDLPPLEPIDASPPPAPSASLPPLSSSTSSAPAPSTAAENASPPSTGPSVTQRAGEIFSFLSAFTNPLSTSGSGRGNRSGSATPIPATTAPVNGTATGAGAGAGGDDDSDADDMPPLEPLPSAAAVAGKKKEEEKQKNGEAEGKRNGGDASDSDDMPPLEPIPSSAGVGAGKGKARQEKQKKQTGGDVSDPDDMPLLEPIPSATPAASTSTAKSALPTAAAKPAASSSSSSSSSKPGFKPRFPTTGFGPSAAAAGNKSALPKTKTSPTAAAGAGADSDEDMPALEPIPGSGAEKKEVKNGAKKEQAKKEQDGYGSDDSMPPLEPIDGSTPPPAASSASKAKKEADAKTKPTEFFFRFTSKYAAEQSAKAAAKLGEPADSDDEMPPLEAIPSATSSSNAKKAAKKEEDDDDDMPPLEPVSAAASSSANKAAKLDDDEDDMPPLEPIPAAASSATSTSAASASSASPARATSSLPTSFNFSFSPPPASTPLPPVAGSRTVPAPRPVDVYDDLPALEPIAPAAPVAVNVAPPAASASNPFPSVLAAPPEPTTSLGPGYMFSRPAAIDDDGDADWEDEEGTDEGLDSDYDDEEDEDEDEDDSDGEYDSDHPEYRRRIFPDGLPSDPLLPLLFINRSFLHAARKILYRRVHVAGPFVGSLLLRSLQAEQSAGFLPGDEVEVELEEDAKTKAKGKAKEDDPPRTLVKRNVLADVVRLLSFNGEGDCSLGRGGGQNYIDCIKLCKNLDTLVLRPMFLKSATKPLLAALRDLKRLKSVDLTTSTDPSRPFVVTAPRIYSLLKSWPELEELTVQGLKSGDDGPMGEMDDFWYDVDYDEEEEDQDWMDEEEIEERRNRVKPKGLKKVVLYGFDLGEAELTPLLRDSKETLTQLTLTRPGLDFMRRDFAMTMLTFGHKLTILDLSIPTNWYPVPAPGNGVTKKPFPVRPKNYKVGAPKHDHVTKIAEYHYLLDAVMPYLPALKEVRWDGPIASTSVFSFFPPSLSKVAYGHCPGVQPQQLAKLLRKTVTRTKQVTNADGAKVNKSFSTKVARGMTCFSVMHDDLSWTDADINALEGALAERSCCLHLSSDGGAVGGGLGGWGGLMGGGLGVPIGGVRVPLVPVMLGAGGAVGGAFGPAGAAGERSLRKLVKDYQSLNSATVPELSSPPTPLAFSRFVAANRPVVVRGGGIGAVPALDKWSDQYLNDRLGDKEVQISVSPLGNADSIVSGLFVEPASVSMPLSQLFSKLREEEGDVRGEATSPVFYLQTQNGNLGDEYVGLQEDVGMEGPAWAREVFGEPPDAVNVWMGGRRSKTSMHKDPYENIYLVVRGTKTFTLMPPVEGYCLHEQLFPHATYTYNPSPSPSSSSSPFSIQKSDPELLVPWIPVDPLAPDLAQYPRFELARPMKVTLRKGDMLYLPALWYHLVEQDVGPGPSPSSASDVQAAIAVNWWTDMRHEGHFWSTLQFVRRAVLRLDGREEEDGTEESDEEE